MAAVDSLHKIRISCNLQFLFKLKNQTLKNQPLQYNNTIVGKTPKSSMACFLSCKARKPEIT